MVYILIVELVLEELENTRGVEGIRVPRVGYFSWEVESGPFQLEKLVVDENILGMGREHDQETVLIV